MTKPIPMLHVWLSDANPATPYVVVTEGSDFEWYGEIRCRDLGGLCNAIVDKVNRGELGSREPYGAAGSPPPPAFADGPVADTAEPVTPQPGIVGAEPDRDDGHTMGHTE